MIASISRGASFRGLLAYVLDPKHEPVLVGTNMGGRDVPELAKEFGTACATAGRPGLARLSGPWFMSRSHSPVKTAGSAMPS